MDGSTGALPLGLSQTQAHAPLPGADFNLPLLSCARGICTETTSTTAVRESWGPSSELPRLRVTSGASQPAAGVRSEGDLPEMVPSNGKLGPSYTQPVLEPMDRSSWRRLTTLGFVTAKPVLFLFVCVCVCVCVYERETHGLALSNEVLIKTFRDYWNSTL